jgi:hypothetical protein
MVPAQAGTEIAPRAAAVRTNRVFFIILPLVCYNE